MAVGLHENASYQAGGKHPTGMMFMLKFETYRETQHQNGSSCCHVRTFRITR